MGRPPLSEWLMPEGKAQPQDFDRLRVLGNIVMPKCAHLALSLLGHQQRAAEGLD